MHNRRLREDIHNELNEKDIYVSEYDCPICNKIMSDPKNIEDMDLMINGSIKIFDHSKSGPLVRKLVYYPHVCVLSTLKLVQDYYIKNYININLFNVWMSMNGGDYQIGSDKSMKYLWDERFEFINFKDKTNILEYNIDEYLEDLNSKKYDIVIRKCKKHKHICHAYVKNPENKSIRRNRLKLFNKLYPFPDDVDKRHANIDVASLITWALVYGYGFEVNEALSFCPVGMNNQTVCFLIISKLGNPLSEKNWDLMDIDNACCMSIEAYKGYFKAVTIAIRRTELWYDDTPASIDEIAANSYWELSIGRHKMVSDWDKERNNRVGNRLPLKLPNQIEASEDTNEEYLKYAEIVLDEVIHELISDDIIWESWHNHCMNRHSWLSSGSAGAKYKEIKGEKIRLNRRAYMETIPINVMEEWLYEEPIIKSIGSNKYEMGKDRAIYGTETKDQAIMSYVIMDLEANLSNIIGVECGVSGSDEVRSIYRRKMIVAREGEECTMLDYSDFNLQHTPEAQSLVFKCIKKRLQTRGNVHLDAIVAAEWCEKALLNQWVTFPGDKKAVKISQGMFSGLRATNFINTILNVTYFRVAKKWTEENLNIIPIDLYNLHHGDDVWVSNKSRLWAIVIYEVLKSCGLIFSDRKQGQSINSGEFLRVLYGIGKVKGFMARALATFIEKPLQSETDLSPATKCVGLNSQINTLYRRGLDQSTCEILWDAAVRYSLKLFIREEEVGVDLPISIVVKQFIDGGLDIGYPMTMCSRGIKTKSIPSNEIRSKLLENNIEKNTSEAYVSYMSEKLQIEINAEMVKEGLHRSNISDSIPTSDKISCLKKHFNDLCKWRENVLKAQKDSKIYRNYNIMMEWIDKTDTDMNALYEINEVTELWMYKKEILRKERLISHIVKAIASSPYKDIDTAKRALGLGTVLAAKMAIMSCRKNDYRIKGLSAYGEIRGKLSEQILGRILDGTRGFGPSFESMFNPICLSLISHFALDSALHRAMAIGIKEISEWDKLLYNTQAIYLKSAIEDGHLLEISNY